MATILNPGTAKRAVSVVLPAPELNDAERTLLLRHGGRDGERAVHADGKRGARWILSPGEAVVIADAAGIAEVERQREGLEAAGLVVTL